jgi:hypothetical protein
MKHDEGVNNYGADFVSGKSKDKWSLGKTAREGRPQRLINGIRRGQG